MVINSGGSRRADVPQEAARQGDGRPPMILSRVLDEEHMHVATQHDTQRDAHSLSRLDPLKVKNIRNSRILAGLLPSESTNVELCGGERHHNIS